MDEFFEVFFDAVVHLLDVHADELDAYLHGGFEVEVPSEVVEYAAGWEDADESHILDMILDNFFIFGFVNLVAGEIEDPFGVDIINIGYFVDFIGVGVNIFFEGIHIVKFSAGDEEYFFA